MLYRSSQQRAHFRKKARAWGCGSYSSTSARVGAKAARLGLGVCTGSRVGQKGCRAFASACAAACMPVKLLRLSTAGVFVRRGAKSGDQ